jgi:hypothetical protein
MMTMTSKQMLNQDPEDNGTNCKRACPRLSYVCLLLQKGLLGSWE